MESLLILLCAAGRMHGIGNSVLRFLSLIIVTLAFGIAAAILWGSSWLILLGVLSASCFALGHGNFYMMRGAQDGVGSPPSTPEDIEIYGGRWLWLRLTYGAPIQQPAYSWAMMGLKWLLIGLPLGPYALFLAAFAPMAYALSFKETQSSALAEWLTTIYAAAVITYAIF